MPAIPALGASPRRQHRFGNARAGSARPRATPAPQPRRPVTSGRFIAERKLVTITRAWGGQLLDSGGQVYGAPVTLA
jgi:hypothetical protein